MTTGKKPMDELGKLQQFRAERSDNSVLHLVFDMPGRPMNVFSNAAIAELAIFSRWLRHRCNRTRGFSRRQAVHLN